MSKVDIISYITNKVIKSINCGKKSGRQLEKVEDGVNINLNHEEYYTIAHEDKPLKEEVK